MLRGLAPAQGEGERFPLGSTLVERGDQEGLRAWAGSEGLRVPSWEAVALLLAETMFLLK